jgi:hypothetical protein
MNQLNGECIMFCSGANPKQKEGIDIFFWICNTTCIRLSGNCEKRNSKKERRETNGKTEPD